MQGMGALGDIRAQRVYGKTDIQAQGNKQGANNRTGAAQAISPGFQIAAKGRGLDTDYAPGKRRTQDEQWSR
jgi:hypothetical protein